MAIVRKKKKRARRPDDDAPPRRVKKATNMRVPKKRTRPPADDEGTVTVRRLNRKKLARKRAEMETGNQDVQKISEGVTKFRLVRRPQDDEAIFVITAHWVPTRSEGEDGKVTTSNRPYACLAPGENNDLRNHGMLSVEVDSCPADEAHSTLAEHGSKASTDLANQIRSSPRAFAYMQEERNGELGVPQVYGMPVSLARKIAGYDLDPDKGGDDGISDPQKPGALIEIDYNKNRKGSDMYQPTLLNRTVRPGIGLRELSKLPHPLEVAKPRIIDYDEMQKLLANLGVSTVDDEEVEDYEDDYASDDYEEEEERPRRPKKAKKKAKAKKKRSRLPPPEPEYEEEEEDYEDYE